MLTTLQCNFACDYCYQGDRGDYNKFAEKMTLETAAGVGDWIERELDRVRPETLTLMFFGGEPLLNLPVMYYLAERLWRAARERGVDDEHLDHHQRAAADARRSSIGCVPFGLTGVKITLDGDRETHNRMRPLRGGQGTFDRIIENIRRVAGRVRIAIGGNFDESSADSYPALLQFLSEQDFADKLVKVNFKPVIRTEVAAPKGVLPLTPVGADGKPLGGTCMTAVGSGTIGEHGLRLVRLRGRADVVPPRGNEASRVPDAGRRAQRPVPRAHDSTRTRSGPTDRSTPAPGSPATSACRPDTSTTGTIRGARTCAASSTGWIRGRTAETVRSSPCVRGDAWWRRTHSLAT